MRNASRTAKKTKSSKTENVSARADILKSWISAFGHVASTKSGRMGNVSAIISSSSSRECADHAPSSLLTLTDGVNATKDTIGTKIIFLVI